MRCLALLVVLGCSGAEPAVKPGPGAGGAGGSSQGGMPPSSAGTASEAGTGGAGAGGAGGSSGASGSEAGGSSGSPAAGTGGAGGPELGGSGGGAPVDACPEVMACTEECDLMAPGPVMPGFRCSLGSFSCGDTLGYYASDGMEWTFVTETSAEVAIAAGEYCDAD